MLRSTLTRSPPTHTSTPWLTTTPPPTSMLPSPMTERAMPRVLTVSTFLTAASSMLATPPTPSTDTSLQLPMTELLYILMLRLTLPLPTLPLLSTLHLLSTLLPMPWHILLWLVTLLLDKLRLKNYLSILLINH